MPISDYSRNLKNKQRFGVINIKLINRLMMACLVLGVAFYVVGMNDSVVKGFKLQELRSRSVSLSNENKNFSSYVTSLRSHNNLAKRVEKLNMVETDKVDYLKMSSVVAVR